jgi:transcriptional regulator GlxA family with amidase domain
MKSSMSLLSWLLASTLPASSQNTTLPSRFGMIVYPGFQTLDVYGPLDALFFLSLTHPIELSIISYSLDPVSTSICNQTAIGSAWGTSVIPTHTYANPPEDLDVLLVPGGLGNRNLPGAHLDDLLEYLRTTYPDLQYLISICTGSGLLARSGLLDGRNATTNKQAWWEMTRLGRKTNWIAKARWVVDGNVWTASGVTAGIDALFAWMTEVYGEAEAEKGADGIEHTRTTDPHNDPFADLAGAVDVPPVETV